MSHTQRDDYPRPQFVRQNWLNLNGEWEFEFDDSNVGETEKWHKGEKAFSRSIQVPFAFQSKLSGIADNDFHDIVWYRKQMNIPDDWKGKQIILYFGAVDYVGKVWVNGEMVAMHEGGHTPFQANITAALSKGENIVVVRAEDFSEDLSLPRGKQYWLPKSAQIFYTRTTGIWQTVWLEPVEDSYLEKVKFTPDIDKGEIKICSMVKGVQPKEDICLKVKISFKGNLISEDIIRHKGKEEVRTILLQDFMQFRRCHLWTPENPNLYDVSLTVLKNGEVMDEVSSYFGMRKVSIEKGKFRLNNRVYYMRLVLDQGYFPDGNLTPPSDEAIKKDVELTKELGFNGARKHQKLEDPRYLYWCDKLGLLLWSEMANAYQYSDEYVHRFTKEWQETIERDYNHPCVVAWVPLNESWGVWNIKDDALQQQHALTMYHLTKSLDQTRPVISNDGWEHVKTDLCTIHDYEPDQHVLEDRYSNVDNVLDAVRAHTKVCFVGGYEYEGQPIIVSEFGGIAYKKSEWEGWGYSGAENEEDFLKKLKAVVQPMITSPVVQGFCYTQLTDVEQEINGLLTYDRTPKAPLDKMKAIISERLGRIN